MKYDIELIKLSCEEYGIKFTPVSENEININIADNVEMVIANTEDDDTYWGFTDVPWHTHDELILDDGQSGFVYYKPEDMLDAWATGDILLVSLIKEGKVVDRWLSHKGDPSGLKYIEIGETIKFETASNNTIQKRSRASRDSADR